MDSLQLHSFHQALGAAFSAVNGREVVGSYGDTAAEYAALHDAAGLIDLSSRGRVCLLGADRARFLHGQVTNRVKDLKAGGGCYAAIVSAKGKIQSDLHIYILENEILLDFEPGLMAIVQERLEKFVVAEDVQVMDVSADYGLISVQGPKAADALVNFTLPGTPHSIAKTDHPALGEIYVANHPRTGISGYDVFVPSDSMAAFAELLKKSGARWCGWDALEISRIEAGIPRFGADMDDSNLAPEALGADAISYSKGCYIGQEVIARIRTYGQVAKALRGLRLPAGLVSLPARGDKLFMNDKEAGYITSVAKSPKHGNIALGYVRREANAAGTELKLQTGGGFVDVQLSALPFNS
jgi:folate-binding protein YgfZ